MSVRPTPPLPLGEIGPRARMDRKIRAALLFLPSLLFYWGCSNPEEPKPPSGGERFELSFERFTTEVEPILRNHGCASEGDCHGGGVRGTFSLSTASDLEFDFRQASLQVDGYAPERSPLLLKPLALAAGGVPHSAKPFATIDDPDYQLLRAWVMDVAPARRARIAG